MSGYNSNGDISVYGFSCGYVEKCCSEDNSKTAHFFREHSIYHVKFCDFDKPFNQDHNIEGGRRFWYSFESVRDARKCFNKYKRACLS